MTPPPSDHDTTFAGSIPKLYEMYFVPLIFEPYAQDLAQRLASRSGRARAGDCGGHRRGDARAGVPAARRCRDRRDGPEPGDARPGAAVGTARPVEWRQADAMQLPFPGRKLRRRGLPVRRDVLSRQGHGVRGSAPRVEARRPLHLQCLGSDRGERIRRRDHTALEAVFPDDPPRFMARTPHGYHDRAAIERDLIAGGFTATPEIATVAARSRAASARIPAIAFCQGTPLRSEIEARGAARLGEATDAAERAIAARFGAGAVDSKIQAHVVTVVRRARVPTASASPCARLGGGSWRPWLRSSRLRSAGVRARRAARAASSAGWPCRATDRRPRARCGRASCAA